MVNLSIIIPIYNESDSIVTLKKEIDFVVSKEKIKTELIFIDDGSTDDSWQTIEQQKMPVPDDIMSMTFSATTTLAFCEHVMSRPDFLGFHWHSAATCADCSSKTLSLKNTLKCIGV